MRSLFPALITAMIIAISCQWTPDRDNPYDPESPLYSPPPQPNRPPEIDTFYMTTDVRATYLGEVCDFQLICIVSDSDFNVNPSNVAVFLDNDFFDFMNYNSSLDQYFINRSQRDLPSGIIDDYVNHPLRVEAFDDSLAGDTATIFVVTPFRDYPTIRHPENDDILEGVDTTFAWDQWNGIQISGFDISFKYLNDILLQDLAFHGVPPTDTVVAVDNYPFRPSNNGRELYAWYVTATDVAGNRATSFPGTFFYFLDQ